LAGGDVAFMDAEAIGAGYAILGATIGTLTGLAIGSGKEEYIIKGDRNVYISYLPVLKHYEPQKKEVTRESGQ
jgi:CRISPR/Cas system CSM-associated protein Csm3 (group 7 of RAMP superfamily)